MLGYWCESYFKNKSRIWKGVWGPENVQDLRTGGGGWGPRCNFEASSEQGKIPLGMARWKDWV